MEKAPCVADGEVGVYHPVHNFPAICTCLAHHDLEKHFSTYCRNNLQPMVGQVRASLVCIEQVVLYIYT